MRATTPPSATTGPAEAGDPDVGSGPDVGSRPDVGAGPAVTATTSGGAPWCPFRLGVTPVARMLNAELTDDPVYDAVEVQYLDDEVSGRGMLVFLSRRADRRVDYYAEPGLRLDRDGYELGGGTGTWQETRFARARLEVAPDGVDLDVAFVDVDGRSVELRIDDRDGRPRRRAAHLLAPVGAGVDRPTSLLLVCLRGFDLVRAGPGPRVLRIDGRDAAIGRLPGTRLHRRQLIKYAAPLVAVEVARAHDGPVPPAWPDQRQRVVAGGTAAVVTGDDPEVALRFVPAVPDPATVPDGAHLQGRWRVELAGRRVTGGTWTARRSDAELVWSLDVDEPWQPDRSPWLPALVTRLVPVFRRWPTTYRWRATLRLGAPPVLRSGWQRTDGDGAASYRRVTRGRRRRSSR